MLKGLLIYDKQKSISSKNTYKSSETQAGSGLKNFRNCCHFVKFLTYFCSQLKVLSTFFQINSVYDFL